MYNLITDVPGVKVGHFTDLNNGTGCSVILLPKNSIGSCEVRGGAPGTRETALLAPDKFMNEVHALLLTGGSAFGLDAAAGVMKYLQENKIGYQTPWVTVPIVPSAVIFDYSIRSSKIYPTADDAYYASTIASTKFKLGSVGAGTGATVGKWNGMKSAMKGGVGSVSAKIGNLIVGVFAVVNSLGDVLNEDGSVLAGAVSRKKFLGKLKRDKSFFEKALLANTNTTLVAVITNAKLSKLENFVVAQRMHNGFARSISPAHTQFDGDISFSFSTGKIEVPVDAVSEIAAELTAGAIRSAVKNATSIFGIPSLK